MVSKFKLGMQNCLFKFFLFVIFSFSVLGQVEAQSGFSLYAQGGALIGTPMGKIPEGATGKLGVKFSSGIELKWIAFQNFSLHLGALFAHKSNEFQTPVEGKYNISDGVLGVQLPFPININYRGTVNGAISNKYIDIPLYGGFRVGRRLTLALGYQYSRLLEGQFDGEVDVRALALSFPDQKFDESHLLRKDDHAAVVGAYFSLTDRWEIRFRFAGGLNDIFTEIPEGMSSLHNLYMGVMLAYGFSL